MPDTTEPGPLARQLAWFVGLYCAGLAGLGAVALLIRWALPG